MKTTTTNKSPVSVMGAMLQQVTISKPAAKQAKGRTLAQAAKDYAKTADRMALEGAKATISAAKHSPICFAIVDYARPKAGAALFAHTSAFLKLSGLQDGKAYPKAKASQVVGNTAIKYHMSNGNFEATSAGLTLSAKGNAFFMSRNSSHPINPELEAAFIDVLTTGNVNDKANVKSVHSRIAIK